MQKAKSTESPTYRLAHDLERLTRLESRVTILGYLQRGGTPSARDRVLATKLGVACSNEILNKNFGNMIAVRGDTVVPVPIAEVAGNKKFVPLDHEWVLSARKIGTCLGDKPE